MSAINRRSAVYRQLEAYDEVWKRDHDEAIACHEWEDALAVGVNIFHMLREREESWREQVFRGATPFSDDDNHDHQRRFADWLDTTRPVLAEILPELEKRFGTIEGASKLRDCAALAKQILLQWQAPRLSTAIGLREQTLSPEAAVEFDRLHKEAQQNPPPIAGGSLPQPISTTEFFAIVRRQHS
jgi:hypothetical protein